MTVDQSLLGIILFTATMILPIAPFSVWYRNRVLRRVGAEDRERILLNLHRFTIRIWIAWALAIVFLAIWIGGDAYTRGAFAQLLPLNIAVLFTFHLVVWPFVMPMHNRLEKLVAELQRGDATPTAVREASLKPRRLNDYMPAYWKGLTAILALSGLFVIGVPLMQISAIENRLVLMAVVFAASGIFELLIWAFVMRMEVTSAATYGGLTQTAAEELRQFRIRGFFWILVIMSVVFYACALGIVEVGRGAIPEANMGIVGGVIGTVVGIAGAAFGVAASLKMNRLRQESNATNS